MINSNNIGEVIGQLASRHGEQKVGEVSFEFATVETVDIDSRTCTATSVSGVADVTYTNVRLMATVDDGLLLVPAKESTIIVGVNKLMGNFVAMFSELDGIYMVANNTVSVYAAQLNMLLDQNKMTLKNDDASLGQVLQDILTHIQSLTVPTPAGTSGVPVNISDFQNDSTNLSKILNS